MKRVIVLGSGLDWPAAPDVLRVDKLSGPNVDQVFDLEDKHWPWPENSFIHANASHIIEHVTDIPLFIDNVWRILHPGGTLLIKTPDAISGPLLAFSDPTHKHYLTKWSFVNYVTPTGRAKFGYVEHEWAILDMEVTNGEIITLLGKVPNYAPSVDEVEKMANGGE